MKTMDEMVSSFLAWPLPDDVCSDSCASVPGYPHRSGTNLLNADQARQMLTHVLGGVLAEAAKSERRAITFGDIVAQQTMAMRAALVDNALRGSGEGMAWIFNTLSGPGHLPDIDAAQAEGGAQAMFDREMAEHEAFRTAHPAP